MQGLSMENFSCQSGWFKKSMATEQRDTMALMMEPVTTGSTSRSIPIRGVNLLHLHPASACSHSCRLTAWFSCCWDSLSGCHTCSTLPWKAARGESRQRTSSTAGAAGKLHATRVALALAQHPSSVGSLFPAAEFGSSSSLVLIPCHRF